MKLIFLASVCLAASFATGQRKSARDLVVAFLKSEMAERRIPGMQVAVVQRGKIVFSAAYGTANLQYGVPVTARSVFSVNSATKPFTGVAVMQLVEAGKLKLEDPVSAYLDGLPEPWRKVTIKQLMTHVSGLPDIIDQRTGKLIDGLDEAAAWAKVQTLPMEFKTGESYSYNQTNYLLIGKVIDRLSGVAFTQFMKENQFDKAGMKGTGFGDSRDVVSNQAQSYRYVSQPGGSKLTNAYMEFPTYLRTAGGINSTARDIANWLAALQNGNLLRSKSSLRAMWEPGRFNDGSKTPWALGWPTQSRSSHRAVAGIGGGRSAFYVYPDDDLAVVVLTNLAGGSPEEFIDTIAGFYVPAIRTVSPGGYSIYRLREHLNKLGYSEAVAGAANLKHNDPQFELKLDDVNAWGYRLIEKGRIKDAIAIFKLNVSLFPKAWETYDGLAEAYETAGQKSLAIKNYELSLELNPSSSNAEVHLKKLKQ